MIISNLLLFVFLTPQFSDAGISSKQMSEELSSLYKQLGPNDPSRPHLALRLADALFDYSLEFNKATDFSAKNMRRYEKARLRSIRIYQSVLGGLGGRFKKPKGKQRIRILFQLARLHFDQGQLRKAKKIWNNLAQQDLEPSIRKDSALRLAEQLEFSNNRQDLKKAGRLYTDVLDHEERDKVQAYVFYRRAWIYHRIGKSQRGLKDLKISLEKSDPSLSDEIINSVVQFLPHAGQSLQTDLELIDKISEDFNRPGLRSRLIDSYQVSGQDDKYGRLLSSTNKKSPSLLTSVSLLEFYYNSKDHQNIAYTLSLMKEEITPPLALDQKELEKAQSTFYDLIFQWDSERESQPAYGSIFGQSTLLFSGYFPEHKNFLRVVDGWLNVTPGKQQRVDQLSSWIKRGSQFEPQLRQKRAALAKDLNLQEVYTEDLNYLAQHSKNSDKQRSFRYAYARSLFDQGKQTQAYPILIELTKRGKTGIDSINVYSINLALSHLEKTKQYDIAALESKKWLNQKWTMREKAQHKKARLEIAGIREKALFEKARGEVTSEHLALFKDFCLKKKFTPLSCENAENYAVQLKEQDSLITVLKAQDKKQAVASELEYSGRFREASLLLAKINKNPTLLQSLKMALLFELDGDFKARNRTLTRASRKLNQETPEGEQKALYFAMKDAGLLNKNLLSLPFSNPLRLQLALDLEAKGKSHLKTRNLILAECSSFGPWWEKVHFEKLKKQYGRVARMKFVGRNSEKRFNRKVAAMKGFVDQAGCLKDNGSAPSGALMSSRIGKLYKDMNQQVLNTPIPKGLDAELLVQVKAQISEMAKPFETLAGEWEEDYKERYEALEDSEKSKVNGWIANNTWPTFKVEKSKPLKATWLALNKKLRLNPNKKENIAELHTHLKIQGRDRLASYFEGRLENMKAETEKL